MITTDVLGYLGVILSLGFGVPGLIISLRPEFIGFFRIRPDTTGLVFVDSMNIEHYFQRANSEGFALLRDRLVNSLKSSGLSNRPVVVCPAEVDYLLPFLVAAKAGCRFCAVNTNAAWDENPALQALKKERYGQLLPDDRVVLCMPVITTGEFLLRVLRYLDEKRVRIVSISCAIDATRGVHKDILRQRNLSIASVYKTEEPLADAGAPAMV